MSNVCRLRIAHIVYSFSEGGLENVIVQLINRLPVEKFEHVLISLTDISKFKNRIFQKNIKYIELNKKPGHAIPLYPRIYKILRQIKPDIVHTCNFAALETVPLSWLAGVPLRIHAEHGWDIQDPRGEKRKYQYVRRFYSPFVNRYISVSQEIDSYLNKKIKVPSRKRNIIINGVDTKNFRPKYNSKPILKDCPLNFSNYWVIGTIGRLQAVKNQVLLAKAFINLQRLYPEDAKKMRLVIIGAGVLKTQIETMLSDAGCKELAWVPGARSDIPEIMQNFDCFVLPSLSEGTSCTLQEAMATGLPVIATAVGGNADLIGVNGGAGRIVESENVNELTSLIKDIYSNPQQAAEMGRKARQRIIDIYGIEKMVEQYAKIFKINYKNI